MDMDLATADAGIAEHRARVAFADRFGPLLSTGGATATTPSRRTAAVRAVSNLLRVAGAACRGLGDLAHDSREGLRSNEHDLAAQGITWPTDEAYDHVVAAEMQAARQRRLAAGTIRQLAPDRLPRSHGTATGKQRVAGGWSLARVGQRLRVTPHAAAVGGSGQSGD